MVRAPRLAFALFAALLVSCGGGGSSPTEPDPIPRSLAGTWRGELSGSAGGGAFTCTLELDLEQDQEEPGLFLGSWEAGCPDAAVGGLAVAFDVGGITLLSAFSLLPGENRHPLATCGWSAPVTVRGNELTGTWQPPDDCADPSFRGGPLALRFVG